MSLNCSEVQEFIGQIKIQAVLKPFLLSSSFCQRVHPSTDCPLQNQQTLPSTSRSSRQTYHSIIFSRNGRVMLQCSGYEFWHCKTTVIEWLCISVYPYPFMDRYIIGRQIHNQFRSWLSLCHTSSCVYEQLNVCNRNFFWRFCDVFVDTINNTNPWNCLVFKQGFDHDTNTITSFVRIEFYIQSWADIRIRTNAPSLSECFQVSKLCVFSTCCLLNLRSFFNCNEELSFPIFLKETSVGA